MSATTHPSFGPQTTATEVARAFSNGIKGKTFVITGVSPRSLGSALALSLSSQSPALLILASRTQAKLNAIVGDILSKFPGVNLKTVLVDLSDLKSVRDAVGEIGMLVREAKGSGGKGIDGLFNNAGINSSQRRLTKEGVELQFGTNHLGPFLLTNLLMPLLLVNEGGSRIVMTSSEVHRISPMRFSDYNQEPGKKVDADDQPRRGLPAGILRNDGGYEPAVAYGQSKTANVLMAVGLNKRLRMRGVESFAVMPGTIMTDLVRDLDETSLKGMTASTDVWKDINQGAATMLVAAFDPKLSSEAGVYLDHCQLRKPSKWAVDAEKAARLWKLSEDLVGERFSYGVESKL